MLTRTEKVLFHLLRKLVQRPRIWKYRLLSDNQVIFQGTHVHQPILASGKGQIILGRCHIGVWPSPYFYSGCFHIEARGPRARVQIGDRTWINNNAVIIAELESITIGDDTLIGTEFTVYDSDFHDLRVRNRTTGTPSTAPVAIGNNVFIGSRVTVLKGVTIGDNSVVACGAVVTRSVPADTIVGGVPAKVIGKIPE